MVAKDYSSVHNLNHQQENTTYFAEKYIWIN